MTDSVRYLELPWWLRPLNIFVTLNVVMGAIAWWVSDSLYSVWGAAKYFGPQEFGIVLVAVISFVLGNYLGVVSKFQLASPRNFLHLAFNFFCVLSLVAYGIWLTNAIFHGLSPDMLYSFVKGEARIADDIKDTFATLPGITTMAQFGITVASLYPFLTSVSFLERWMFRLLAAICLTRAVLLSERLAFIEFTAPLLLAFVARRYSLSSLIQKKRIDYVGPPLAGTSLFFIFAFGEYFRSWQYYIEDYDSFWQFMASRLASYYVTALNNGALLLQQIGILPCPFFSLSSLWHFPWLPKSFRYENFFSRDPELEYFEALKVYSTEELNNGSGIFIPFIDFGFIGFILYWMGMAFISRILLRAYCRSTLVGQLFFPLFLIAAVESPRIAYLTNTRAFPAILGGLITLIIARTRAKN